jgi:hypothetical protein
MKLLSEYRANMSMEAGQELCLLLKETLEKQKVTHVLETGTYCGLGSTTFVAESFPASSPPKIFVTVEINWASWRQAKRNLRRFPFVTPLWGRTVTAKAALQFIDSDYVLRNPGQYPDIFIDDTRDPLRFYREEILGALGGAHRSPARAIGWLFDRVFSYAGDDLLEKYLLRFQTNDPLIVMDSAGGIGFLEFSILQRVMQNHSYLLLLDDINHIKHFRSCERIKKDRQFSILGIDESHGWLLAKHAP